MRARRRLPLVLLMLGALAVAPPVTAEDALPHLRGEWLLLSTPNFELVSNYSPRIARRHALELEQLHAAMARITGKTNPPSMQTTVVLCRTPDTFADLRSSAEQASAPLPGFFLPTEEAYYIATDGSVRSPTTTQILYHEYAHLWVDTHVPGAPLWYDEGLAEMLQSFHCSARTMSFAGPVPQHLRVLRERELLPLHRILAIDHDSAEYTEPGAQQLYYAQSWALVHYLMAGSSHRRSQLERFVELCTSTTTASDAFDLTFGDDVAALEEEVLRHIRRGVFATLTHEASCAPAPAVDLSRLDPPAVLTRLARIMALQTPPLLDNAAVYAAAAQQLAPHDPHVLSCQALITERRQGVAQALPLYERAAAQAPDDYLVQYFWGRALHRAGQRLEVAQSALLTSNRLKPSFGPTLAELTLVSARLADASPHAVGVAQQALSLYPHRPDLAFAVLHLYLNAGMLADARALYESSFPSGTARVLARKVLAQGELTLAWRLFEHGDVLGAESILRHTDMALIDGEEVALLEDQIELRRAQHRSLSFTAAYNQAARLSTAQAYDKSTEILEELLTRQLTQGQRQMTESLLRDVEDRLRGTSSTPAAIVSDNPWPAFRHSVEEFYALLARGSFEAALTLLAQMHQQCPGCDPDWIAARQQELQRLIDHNRFVEDYNRAVEHFNRHEYGQARRILDEVLAGELSADDRQDAMALRANIRQALTR